MVAGGHDRPGPGPRARGGSHARALRRGADGQPRLWRHGIGRTHEVRRAWVVRGAVHRARARAAEQRRRAVDAFAQARGAPRRRAVLARQPAQRRARVRRSIERGSLPGGSARRARAGRPHPCCRRVAAYAGRRERDQDRCRRTAGSHRWQVAAQSRRGGCPFAVAAWLWDALDLQAADGAYWLLLDLRRQTATWRRASYDPGPARLRARALGLDDAGCSSPGRVTRPRR